MGIENRFEAEPATGTPASGPARTVQTRRAFLRGVGLVAAGVAAQSILAACGGESTETPGSASGGSGGGTSTTTSGGTSSGAGASTPGSQSAGSGSTDVGAIVAGATSGGLSYDPAKTTAIEDWARIQNIYNGLIRFKAGGFEVEGDLAEKWEVSTDGTEYTFNLRKGVKFHKGFGELTAEDVKFSLERQLDPELKALTATYLEDLDRVDVVDDYTAKLVLKRNSVPFLSNIIFGRPMTGAIISKAAADELGNDNYTEHPIGTGPFIFESEVPNQSVKMVRNDEYREGPANPSSFEIRTIADEATLSLAIEKGEVHFGNISGADTILKYQDGTKAQLFVGDRMNIAGLLLNNTVEPFNDARVRRALAYAVNTQELVDGALGGFGLRAGPGYIHPKMAVHDESLKPIDYDPERAKKELADLGITDLTIECVTYTGSSWSTVGALLQQQFAAAGVNFKLQQLERGVLTRRRGDKSNPASIVSFTRNPEPDSFVSLFDSSQFPPGGLNYCWYSGIDDLLQQEREELDEAKRAEIFKQIQRKLAEDLPMIPIWHSQGVTLGSLGVKGFVPDSYGGYWIHGVTLG